YFFVEPGVPSWIAGEDEVFLLLLFAAEAGSIALMGGTVHAARRQAERSDREARLHRERFAQGEKRYRLLVEGVRDHAPFLLDPAGRVATWDAGAERVLGYPAAEAVGRHFGVFSPEEDQRAGRPEEELRLAAAQGRFEGAGWRVRRGGQRFWAEV